MAGTVFQRLFRQVKSKDFRDYLMSTHFWGPVCNFAIPIAAINDIQRDPSFISGKMTVALFLYSVVCGRFAWMVTPRNRLLLACHVTNMAAQTVQGCRFLAVHSGRREHSDT